MRPFIYFTSILISYFFFYQNIFSQETYFMGSIVYLNGDTVCGRILSQNEKKANLSCIFKDVNDSLRSYNPEELLAYRIGQNGLYNSKSIVIEYQTRIFFLKCIFKGDINIYSLKIADSLVYFIEDNKMNMIRLSEERRIAWKNGIKQISLPKFNSQLKLIYKDDRELFSEIDQVSKLSHISLIKLAKLYHVKNNLSIAYCVKENDDFSTRKHAKKDFKSGYVIDNQHDTLLGMILATNKIVSSQTCFFLNIKDNSVTQYFPNDILGYRYIDGKYYIAKPNLRNKKKSNCFYEFLIKGKASAYYIKDQSGDHYYIESEGKELIELTEEERSVVRDDGTYIKPSLYKGKLKYSLAESKNIQDDIEKLKLSHESLINLLKEYHYDVCKAEECIVFEKKKLPISLSFNLETGYALSRFDFGHLLLSNYIPSPRIDIGLTISNFMFDVKRLYFQVGASIQYYTYLTLKCKSNTNESELITYNDKRYYLNNERNLELIDNYNLVTKFDVNINTTAVSLPLSFGYLVETNSRWTPFIKIGITTTFVLNQNKDFKHNAFYDEYGHSIPTTLFGYNVELGSKIKLMSQKAILFNLGFNYSQNFNNINEILRLNIYEFAFMVGYEF